MTKSALQIARAAYVPKMPVALRGSVRAVEGAATEWPTLIWEPIHSSQASVELRRLSGERAGGPPRWRAHQAGGRWGGRLM